MKKQQGFTIIEILIMAFILSVVIAAFTKWLIYRNSLLVSRTYADQTKAYTNVFIKYLNDNKKKLIKNITPSSPKVLNWNDMETSKYVPTGLKGKNIYNQAPCLIIIKNNGSNLLHPIMVFTDGQAIDSKVTSRAMALIGGYSGIYIKNTDTIIGDFGLWSYPSFFVQYQSLINSCGGRIAENSIVINIGMMNDFNDLITPDVSVHRFNDKINPNLGESLNTNTIFTDISLKNDRQSSSNKLYFNQKNDIYLEKSNASDSTVRLNNASFVAQSLLPKIKNDPGDRCSPEQLGSVSSQKDSPYGIQSSTLICSYNPPVCQAKSGTDYCFTAIRHNTIIFNNRGSMGNRFICPAGVPIVSDANSNDVIVRMDYRKCVQTKLLEFDCGMGDIFNKEVFRGNSAQMITTPIRVNGNNFFMQIGYKIFDFFIDLNSCDNKCSALGMRKYDWQDWKGTFKVIHSNCPCFDPNQKYWAIYDILSVGQTGFPRINYVTCTSKMILTQE